MYIICFMQKYENELLLKNQIKQIRENYFTNLFLLMGLLNNNNNNKVKINNKLKFNFILKFKKIFFVNHNHYVNN